MSNFQFCKGQTTFSHFRILAFATVQSYSYRDNKAKVIEIFSSVMTIKVILMFLLLTILVKMLLFTFPCLVFSRYGADEHPLESDIYHICARTKRFLPRATSYICSRYLVKKEFAVSFQKIETIIYKMDGIFSCKVFIQQRI